MKYYLACGLSHASITTVISHSDKNTVLFLGSPYLVFWMSTLPKNFSYTGTWESDIGRVGRALYCFSAK